MMVRNKVEMLSSFVIFFMLVRKGCSGRELYRNVDYLVGIHILYLLEDSKRYGMTEAYH